MRAAPLVAAGLAALLALGVGWRLAAPDADEPPPAGAGGEAPTAGAPAEPPVPEREPLPAAEPNDPAAAEPPAPAVRDEPAEAAANVELRVRQVAGHAPVAAFAWRFRARGAATTLRGDGHDGRAGLHLPPGARGQLLVEAAGFAPAASEVAAPPAGAPPQVVDVFLAAAAGGAGITLSVRDTALQPVPHVRVDVFPLQPGDESTGWQLGAALWTRRAASADGRYELPELMPGEYGVRVLATDADGDVLPLLPFLHRFVLTGSNAYVEDVVLEPAGIAEFEFVDATGRALDPAAHGAVQLRLHEPGGDGPSRTWTTLGGGGRQTALDRLPGPGPVAPLQPMPAGSYELLLAIDGQDRLRQFLALRAGERHRLRCVVP
ncbi:MAG: carboxypeptidase regulatory-like domain-containing protein [Planctomycetes bacterium]|nr:carboxypeptidase regulatory-like domain-containing protein [Planctomycetota bacterium]